MHFRDIQLKLDKDIDSQSKRVQILTTESENNYQRQQSIQSLIDNKEQQISKTVQKVGDSHNQIQDLKYTLNKLDAELGYFESQNEQH